MAAMVRGRGPKDVRKTVGQLMHYLGRQIGRASCRERV